VATFVTTFLVQTHVGYVVLAAPLLALGAAWLVVSRVRPRAAEGEHDENGEADEEGEAEQDAEAEQDGGLRSLVWPGVWAAVVAVVLWLPPLVQQLREDPGNLRLIVRWFRHPPEQAHTVVQGWKVVAAQYTATPEWLTGAGPINIVAEPTYFYGRVVPVLLVLVLAAAALWWRRGHPAARSLAAVWLGASALGLLAAARTIGPLYAYRLRWAWVLGAIGGLLVVWLALRIARERGGRHVARVAGPAALAALAALAAVNATAAVRAEVPVADQSRLVAGLAPTLRDEAEHAAGRGEVVVGPGSFGAIGVAEGLVMDLERRGVPARHRDDTADGNDEPPRMTVTVAIDDQVPGLADRPDQEMLAYTGRESLDELRSRVARRDRLNLEVAAGRISFPDYARRSRDLVPSFTAAALFVARP
jgi:hypothetical protein